MAVTQTVTQTWAVDENGDQTTMVSSVDGGWSSDQLGVTVNDLADAINLIAEDAAVTPPADVPEERVVEDE